MFRRDSRYLGVYRVPAEWALGVFGGASTVARGRTHSRRRLRLDRRPPHRERFLREADLTASLSHPNILGVHDRGEYALPASYGSRSIMLVAPTRRGCCASAPPFAAEAVEIITAVASALDYAHQRRPLHRDVRPYTLLILKRKRLSWPTSALHASSITDRD